MAEIELNEAAPGFWPADKVLLGYFAFTSAIEVVWFNQIPGAAWLLALHVMGAALIIAASRVANPGRVTWIFRHWYPLLFVASCYREMAILIPAIRHARADRTLADLDYAFWHANPTVWVEKLYSPLLTESLQIIYTLFVPVVLLVPAVIWYKKRYADFRYLAFLLSLGFLVSYLGYLWMPARGPRFLLEHLQHRPLEGLWLFNIMQALLDRLESAHYDCFPSGHVELTVLACWSSRLISRRAFRVYFLYTLSIIFATVYLRYHYTVDLLAGVVVAVMLILSAPAFFRLLSGRRLSEKGDSIGD